MFAKYLSRVLTAVVATAVLAMIVSAAYAHCGKCLTDAKHFADSLQNAKMTLAAAATLAEVETKGSAVHATVMRDGEGVNVEVHCMVDGEIMAVVVDGKTGKISAKDKVKNLEGHASS